MGVLGDPREEQKLQGTRDNDVSPCQQEISPKQAILMDKICLDHL